MAFAYGRGTPAYEGPTKSPILGANKMFLRGEFQNTSEFWSICSGCEGWCQDVPITQLWARGSSRTCVESNRKEEGAFLQGFLASGLRIKSRRLGIDLAGTLNSEIPNSG